MTDQALGVQSETGGSRKAVVCRPGLAHCRLTPSNCQDLVFDDVFRVKQARKDRDVLASTMRDEGVGGLDVNDLLADYLLGGLAVDDVPFEVTGRFGGYPRAQGRASTVLPAAMTATTTPTPRLRSQALRCWSYPGPGLGAGGAAATG